MPDGAAAPQQETLAVTIDGKQVGALPGELLIAAAERHGTYIPRFCWHPRMKPVGMCRMCLVEVEGPRGRALQPACMLPVTDGMVVDTKSDTVKKAQDGILEFLLINHPLDCPVCDRGGECPLQDQTLTFGPGESRFVEEKRHFEKPIPISDLVYLDRERCIQCARCTRFAEEVAGDPLIQFVDRGNQTQVLTFPDEPFSSYFSGNTVQICPVGALTARPYRFRARPWDLEQVESTCTACSVGCRVLVQSSTDRVTRKLGIDSDPVNHGWLCDKGRFDYEAYASEERLTAPLVKRDDALTPATWGEAMAAAADGIKRALDRSGPGAVAVLGGARLTNEDAYAWAKLAKDVIGTDHVDAQMGDGLPAEVVLGLPRATIDDACAAGTLVLLCPDLKEELPVLYLRLRGAAADRGTPVLELTPAATGMTRHATLSLGYRPGEVGRLAAALAGAEPAVDVAGVRAADVERARELLRADDVVVVLGRPTASESADAVAEAAAALAGIPGVRFLPALRRGNVHGALDMGLAPGMLPGRVTLDGGREWLSASWGRVPEERGLDTQGILQAAAEGRVAALVLLGADPIADFPDKGLARRALAGAGFVVAVDLFATESSRQADVVLAAAGWGEKTGTTTNLEGRVSRLAQKVTAPGTVREDWMIAAELANRLGGDLGFEALAGVWSEIERVAPSHAGLTGALLTDVRYRDGIVVPLDGAPQAAAGVLPEEARGVGTGATLEGEPESIQPAAEATPTGGGPEGAPGVAPPAERDDGPPPDDEPDSAGSGAGAGSPAGGVAPAPPPLVSFTGGFTGAATPGVDAYSLRLVARRRLYDAGVLVQQAPSLAPLAAESRLRANPYDLDRLGVKTGDQVRVASGHGSLRMTVMADAGVPRGSAAVGFNTAGDGAGELIDASAPVTDIRIETL